MATRLAARGYEDYRRSDAALLRLLRRGPTSLTRAGEVLGVSRQAARKALDTLIARGLATDARDPSDQRQVLVQLTAAGASYAEAIASVIAELNGALADAVNPEALVAADAVLRASLSDEQARRRADRLVAPPGTA